MTGILAAFSTVSKTEITLVANPGEYIVGSRTGAGSCTSDSITIIASGGSGSLTYSWSKVSGDTMTLSGSSSATTTFTATLALGGTKTAVYRCTVTDSLGTTNFIDINIELFEVTG